MQYLVIGADGAEYGPTDFNTLKAWVGENRIHRDTPLKDFLSGQSLKAGDLQGLFEEVPTPPVQGAQGYPRGEYTTGATSNRDHGGGAFFWVLAEATLGVALFFAIRGLGFIFCGYALANAIKLNSSGSKYGIVAIVYAAIALAIVVIGWILRLNGNNV